MKKQNLTISQRRENLAKENAFLSVLETFTKLMESQAHYNFQTIKTDSETGECLQNENGEYIYIDYPYGEGEWEKARHYESVYARKIVDFLKTIEICDVE